MVEGLVRLLLVEINLLVVKHLQLEDSHLLEEDRYLLMGHKHLRIDQEVVQTVKDRLRNKKVRRNLFSMEQDVLFE